MVSSTATGFPEIAKASSGLTFIIIDKFHFAKSPAAVPDRAYKEMEAKVRDLETKIAAISGPKTQAFKCQADFDQCWQVATTKTEKWHCLMTYTICLGHGFNLSFPLPGS